MNDTATYRATSRIKAKAIDALDLGPYTLGERETIELYDTFFDTATRTLSQAQSQLLVRHDGVRYQLLFTQSAPASSTGAPAEERAEHLSGRIRKDRASWPASIAEPVAALIGAADLDTLMTMRIRRRTWPVLRDGIALATLTLDRGSITAGGRSMPMNEVRLDLTAMGRPQDLQAVTAILTAALPLTPESHSFVQRGLSLLDHTERLDQINAAKNLTPMTGGAMLAEAGRSLLAAHLGKLHAAWSSAAAGVDPEGVHKMRVATRRLRAMLAALGETVYDDQTVRMLRRGLRRWAAALGDVRDADVFLQTLDAYAATLEPGVAKQLDPLRAMVEERRSEARTRLLTILASKKTMTLAQILDDFVLTVGAGIRDADGSVGRPLVRHWAGSLIWNHMEQVRAYEVVLSTADDITLHDLRIAVKHLRYTLELFKDALNNDVKALHAQLVVVQEHLGQIQDAVVAVGLVDAVLLDHPDNALLHAYRAEQIQHRATLVASVPEVVGTVLALPFRRKLATIIAKI